MRKKIAVLLSSSLFFSAIVYASNFCPKTNTVNQNPKDASFWQCITPTGNCNGNDTFIAATIVNYGGGPRYYCGYSGIVQDSLISINHFPSPAENAKLKPGTDWQWKNNKFVCESAKPNDCPIPIPVFHNKEK